MFIDTNQFFYTDFYFLEKNNITKFIEHRSLPLSYMLLIFTEMIVSWIFLLTYQFIFFLLANITFDSHSLIRISLSWKIPSLVSLFPRILSFTIFLLYLLNFLSNSLVTVSRPIFTSILFDSKIIVVISQILSFVQLKMLIFDARLIAYSISLYFNTLLINNENAY